MNWKHRWNQKVMVPMSNEEKLVSALQELKRRVDNREITEERALEIMDPLIESVNKERALQAKYEDSDPEQAAKELAEEESKVQIYGPVGTVDPVDPSGPTQTGVEYEDLDRPVEENEPMIHVEGGASGDKQGI